MNSTIEDVLETRIAELERKVFGSEKKSIVQDSLPESSVIESLSHANTLISSALSGREKINTLIQRLPELESYMESDSEQVDLQTDMKLEYICAVESEIRETAQRFNQLKELLPVLESDRFNNLPKMSEQLHNLSLKYIELGEQTENVNIETRNMISRYNEIITNISKTLISLDTEVNDMEKAAEPIKIVD